MLQENPWTGLLFLAAIGLNNVPSLLGALVGVTASTAAARLMHYDRKQIEAGLFGYNGALIGIAAFVFLPCKFETGMIAAGFAVLSTVLTRPILDSKIPPLTAPFILLTWFMRSITDVEPRAHTWGEVDVVTGSINGLGQIVFQENILSGLLVILGIMLHSRRDALFALLGSVLGTLTAALITGPGNSDVTMGLFGYNAALCAIALSKKPAWALFAAPFTLIVFSELERGFGTAPLTAPFVLVTWITLYVKRVVDGQ